MGSTRRKSKLGCCSRLGGVASLRHPSGRVTSLARAGCQINPLGNFNTGVFSLIARGGELVLPNLGLEMLHHVHAYDVAQWIICAIEHRVASIGEVFNTVSSQALTMRSYAEAMYRWFEREPRLSFAPFDQWKLGLDKSEHRNLLGNSEMYPGGSLPESLIVRSTVRKPPARFWGLIRVALGLCIRAEAQLLALTSVFGKVIRPEAISAVTDCCIASRLENRGLSRYCRLFSMETQELRMICASEGSACTS
jgi:hypothetical protein